MSSITGQKTPTLRGILIARHYSEQDIQAQAAKNVAALRVGRRDLREIWTLPGRLEEEQSFL